MARSETLGTVHEVDLPMGRIRYHQRGQGPPVVFVHGLLVNADLWRAVVPPVAQAGYRCIAPDWPLGAHQLPVPAADLSPRAWPPCWPPSWSGWTLPRSPSSPTTPAAPSPSC
jgi:pimeloyl-ACP methyl ester carboxylesterase